MKFMDEEQLKPKTDQEITDWMAGLPDKDIEMFWYLLEHGRPQQKSLFQKLVKAEKDKRGIR